jgi:alpha,alpha-trehalase
MSKINSARNKAKKIVGKALKPLPNIRVEPDLRPEDVAGARKYIKDYWPKVQRFHPEDDESLLGLPNSYLVPSYRAKTGFDYNELYYWDSYFMIQGMLDKNLGKQNEELVTGILDDLVALFKRFKVIPNASRTYLTGRSQPPLLTSFIFDVYHAFNKSEDWLKEHIEIAEAEYKTVWMGVKKPNERQVYQGLSRYYDINYLHDLAEAESGWDMTPRFDRRALNFLPIDLNGLLYKYEKDFAKAYEIFGNKKKAAEWDMAALTRKQTIDKLMWDRLKGIYFDYNYVKKKKGVTSSLATYFPMFAGMVSDTQAASLVKALRRFEHKGGLATTDALPLGQFVLGSIPTQWAYPNGWAPLHFVVVKALERYGYHEDAHRIAMKWLKSNMQWYNAEHVFLEKYNVVSPEKPPIKGLYPSQTGFGWTNAVFESFCRDYIDNPE